MKVTFKIATILSRSQMNSSSSQSDQNGQLSTRVIDQPLKKVIIDWLLTVLHIALNERSLSDFSDLINLYKKEWFEK